MSPSTSLANTQINATSKFSNAISPQTHASSQFPQATKPSAFENSMPSNFFIKGSSDDAFVLPEPTFSLEDIEKAQAAAAAFATSVVTAEIVFGQQIAQQQHFHQLESLQTQLQKLVLRHEKVLKMQEEQLCQQPVNSGGFQLPEPNENIQTLVASAGAPHADHQTLKHHRGEMSASQPVPSKGSLAAMKSESAAAGSSSVRHNISLHSPSSKIPAPPSDGAPPSSRAHLTIAESLSQVRLCFRLL
jgi:hypothetical protein